MIVFHDIREMVGVLALIAGFIVVFWILSISAHSVPKMPAIAPLASPTMMRVEKNIAPTYNPFAL